MKATKRITITAAKHELTVIRSLSKESLFFCQTCQAERQHLNVAEMARVLKLSERKVFRLVESEQIHSTETEDGKLLVCVSSVSSYQ